MADNSLPLYAFTTQEDWYGELEIQLTDPGAVPDITSRTFEMHITVSSPGGGITLPAKILSRGDGLEFKQGTTNTITFTLDKEFAVTLPRGEFTADLLEVVGGDLHLFLPVRIRYTEPSGILAFLSRALRATYAANRQPVVAPLGVPGTPGRSGRTIITGTAAPSASTGDVGDYYIRDQSANSLGRTMYGPKVGTAWGSPWSIEAVGGFRDVDNFEIRLGFLWVTYSDGVENNLGKVVGTDGVNGTNGTNGNPGTNGRGITKVEIVTGRLLVTFTDNTTPVDVGPVGTGSGGGGTSNPFTRYYFSSTRGNLTAGQLDFTIPGGYIAGSTVVFVNGAALDESEFAATNSTTIRISNPPIEADTKVEVWVSASTPVRGITKIERNNADHMIVTYTDGTTVDLGLIVGPTGGQGAPGTPGSAGTPGGKGDPGVAGRGITSAIIDGNGHLIITYTDGATADAGVVSGGGGASSAANVSFSPAGNIAATNVQAALVEIDNEKLAKASNLGDLADVAAARNNLQLGSAARLIAGTAAGNVPVLDSGGLLLASLLPALAITDVFPVASQAAMLALIAQRGDVAVRTDQGTAYILKTDDPTTLANWIALPLPAGVVMMVAGLSGPNITAAQLITALQLTIGTNVQAWDQDLQSIADQGTTAYGRGLLNLADQPALAATIRSAATELWALTNNAKFLTPKVMADAMVFTPQTWAATLAMDWTGGFHRTITATGNTTFSGPFVGGADGEAVAFEFVQDGTGSRTIAFSGTYFKLPAGLAITASTAAGAVDIVTGQLRLIGGTLVFQIMGFLKGAR